MGVVMGRTDMRRHLGNAGALRGAPLVGMSMGIACFTWFVEILVPLVLLGTLGTLSAGHLATVGGDSMNPVAAELFAYSIVLAVCGFLAILGVIMGLMGAALYADHRHVAIPATILNALAWAWAVGAYAWAFGVA